MMNRPEGAAPGADDLTAALGDPDPGRRRAALERAGAELASGRRPRPPDTGWVNLHYHTCYSYNPNGWTPSQIAWLALQRGLHAAGIVDFDVLDGVDEMLAAGAILDLRTTAGLECRVYVPALAAHEINSPGEPGIAYHMGIGFAASEVPAALRPFLRRLREISERRNRELVRRVNAYLSPVELDYDRDVRPLTPAGNATERHICLAYARKARHLFGGEASLIAFWSEKLRCDASELEPPEGVPLQNRIRAVTMKAGGVGYVKPDSGSFPTIEQTNRFFLDAGAIPLATWLDGTSPGERSPDELLDLHLAGGAAGVNIIPDRNYRAGVLDEKLRNLRRIVEAALAREMFLVAGTEMNSPGNKFVDDFHTEELRPLLPHFVRGAHIVYGHTVLLRHAGLGYTGEWSARAFASRADRNNFYETVGRLVPPARAAELLRNLPAARGPGAVLDTILHALGCCAAG
ncbi:MAG: hypothetical protein N2652_05940 [Kiritimatiellae bacterium]|nr:hypothetical protein [Kiritimatiellia bacterium]